ncbi:MAG: hypothetical protein JXL80_11655 [Planctomycetes bacterium]|nr:hypothetical protein [Planctomycetota bacterium]
MAEGTPKRCVWQAGGIVLRYLLLLTAFYVYVFVAVDTRLIYDRYVPASMFFSRTWETFKGMADETGGLVNYAAGALHQYYCYGWLGALILTLVAAALAAGIDLWLPVRSRSWLRLLSFVPALGLLVAANYYDLRLKEAGGPLLYALGLLLVLVAANIHAHLPSRRLQIRIAVGLILAALVYHAGGWVYGVTYGSGATEHNTYVPGPLLILVGLIVIREIWTRRSAFATTAAPRKKPAGLSGLAVVGVWLLQLAVLGGAGAITAYATQCPGLKASFRLDYCRHEGLWDDFLKEARQITLEQFASIARARPLDAICLNSDVNFALYNEGLLLDEMFKFPQARGSLLLVDRRGRTQDFVRVEIDRYSDLFFELGRVNAAEHAAHEMLQVDGDRPSTLRLLAEINIVKDQKPAAQTFLGYLRGLHNSPRDECWAAHMLDHYHRHGEFPLDERLRRIRAVNLRDDYIPHNPTVRDDLERLLKSNPNNRMAFEYLVADCLLDHPMRGLPVLVRHLDGFKTLGYKKLPRHVQEALLYYSLQPGTTVSRDQFAVDLDVRRCFERLLRTDSLMRQKGKTARDFLTALALDPEFVKTYYWYAFSEFAPSKGAGR